MENNEKDFVTISNKMIYDEIQKINACLNGNGKKGLKQIIEGLSINVKLQWGFISFIMLALVGGAIKLFM